MNTASATEPGGLKTVTKGFALAAAAAILFNTALAWAKDAHAPLQDWMQSVGGHHWTSHGVADLIVFAVSGIVLTRMKAVARMDSGRVIGILLGAVVMAAAGLVVWFAVY
jgi:hypothetical protein